MIHVRTIFIGTPDFGIPSLKSLIKDDFFDIIGVITGSSKPVGRKQIITPPPIKAEALKHKIPVFQPEKILNLKSKIINLKPDIIVAAAYGQIIPKSILNIPKYGCINVHGSLLPKYRGAACIQAAILNGDKESGATIIKMNIGLDKGPILAQKKLEIKNHWTSGILYSKISKLGAEILIPALKNYIQGKIKPIPQDNTKASYVGLIQKQDGKINWQRNAQYIERLVRAMNPWPGAYAQYLVQNLKIIEADNNILKINKYKIGKVFLDNKKLAIQCGKDALIIKKLQLEAKKSMNSQEFLKGNQDIIGQILN